MNKQEHRFDRLMAEARETNRRRDQSDRASGFCAPADASLFYHLSASKEALKVGVVTEDWTCVAEGLAMVEEGLARLAML